jgi:hypothetical protein
MLDSSPGLNIFANRFGQIWTPPDPVEPNGPLSITQVLLLYLGLLLSFSQPSLLSNGTPVLSGPIIANLNLPAFNSVQIYNYQDPADPLTHIAFDPLSPGHQCQSHPIPIDEVPWLLGYPNSTNGTEFCGVLSAMFVVWYWVALYDFGQVSPGNDKALAVQFPNILTNQTLFDIYLTFINDVALPFTNGYQFPKISALPLGGSNKFEYSPVSLLSLFTCSGRQLKGFLSFVISIIAADTALVLGAYSLFIFIASHIQRRRDRNKSKCL